MNNQISSQSADHSISHGVLGETTSYPKTYSPAVLFPISRSLGRDEIEKKAAISADVVSLGMDWWHCFELSWLNPQGISQVAMARLAIPADSEFIIESKSLKLYLNSLNLSKFDSLEVVKNTIESDLSTALKTQVLVDIFSLNDISALNIIQPLGKNIDQALDNTTHQIGIVDDVTADMLKVEDGAADILSQSYQSHLLRSNCPVTDQPDWGTVQIDITSRKVDEASLLEYLLTYRQHNGFHEQCVEQIFADLTKVFEPSHLMVRAWYTRRGGIDINPCRVSQTSLMPQPSRLVRQ
ncbi:NADPH-dependent 7-cyano-7-deazaguanine reductase QueF [Psychrobacter sp. HD31]|uniref:NADPH-dependent 7-cyano-7-deazaguanine reductase QueF n=1 Tax=Psychrobacter sp. HD31 TaxID=3112003 RepID=UPI003DA6443F